MAGMDERFADMKKPGEIRTTTGSEQSTDPSVAHIRQLLWLGSGCT